MSKGKINFPDLTRINPNLLAIIFMLILGFILYKLLSKNFGGFLGGKNPEIEKQEKEIENIPVDNSQVTKPDSELRKRADLSLQAMDDVGTDEKMLFEQVEGLNSEELKKVYKFFGTKSERVFWLPVFTGDLINWYYNELSGKDLIRMRNIWKGTGLMP